MFKQSYYTDIGVKRKSNQDSLALVKAQTNFGEVLLAAVCDGMGGYSMGELTSKYCIQTLVAWYKKRFPEILYREKNQMENRIHDELFSLIRQMNMDLVLYGRKHHENLGSTLTCLIFADGRYYCVHVGDSRAYEIGRMIRQITDDQSMVAEEVRKGILTEEEARTDRRKNLLTHSIGITMDIKPLFYSGTMVKNTLYLLCSDGFWHLVREGDIRRYLDPSSIEDNTMLRMHLNYLTQQMMDRGEKDNITVVSAIYS